jgi:hypothetical protein
MVCDSVGDLATIAGLGQPPQGGDDNRDPGSTSARQDRYGGRKGNAGGQAKAICRVSSAEERLREGRQTGHRRGADSLCRAQRTRAVRCRGAAPDPAQGGHPPETPRPLFLLFDVPERSSPSRVRSRKSFQNQKRFSSAAHKPRALDCCGPFRKPISDEEKGAKCKVKTLSASRTARLPLVGPKSLKPHLQNKTRKETQRRIASLPSPGSFFNEKMLPLIVLKFANLEPQRHHYGSVAIVGII